MHLERENTFYFYFVTGYKCMLMMVLGIMLVSCEGNIALFSGPSYPTHEIRFWEVNLETTKLAPLQKKWIDLGRDSQKGTQIIGINHSRRHMYYSLGIYEDTLYTVDLENGTTEKTYIDEDIVEYELSPDQNKIMYNKRAVNAPNLWIANINGTSITPVHFPGDSNTHLTNPTWISTEHVIFQGVWGRIYELHLPKNTLKKLTPKADIFHFDAATDRSFLLFEEYSDTSNSIYKIKWGQLNKEFLVNGRHPILLPDTNLFIYQSGQQLHLFDIRNTSSRQLFNLNWKGDLEDNTIAISPDGEKLILTLQQEGVFMIDIETGISSHLVLGDQIPISSDCNNVDVRDLFRTPAFSSNGKNIYFLVHRTYDEGGC